MTIRDLIEDIRKPRPDLWIAIVIATVLLGLAYWLPLHQADLATGRLIDADDKEYFEIANKARHALLQGFTGASFFVTAFVALRNLRVAEDNRRIAEDNHRIAEDRQATDLFVKAAEMLGNEKSLEVRLAGIYSLGRVASAFPAAHWMVMEILMAFVREKTYLGDPTGLLAKRPSLQMPQEAPQSEQTGQDTVSVPIPSSKVFSVDEARAFSEYTQSLQEATLEQTSEDVQAAISVIGRRKVDNDRQGQRIRLNQTKLILAQFNTVDFANAALIGVNLKHAKFDGANLAGSRIVGSLVRAEFEAANLSGADLTPSDCYGAIFSKAILRHTCLRSADLTGALFDGADIYKADFRKALGLTPTQVKQALNWEHAYYDPEFAEQLGLSPQEPQDQGEDQRTIRISPVSRSQT